MKYICPLIVVDSIERSRNLYEEILEQKIKTNFGENITYFGDFAIHQKRHFHKLINNLTINSKSNNFELCFEHDNIEEIEKKLIEDEFEFIHRIVEQPWKQRVLRFYDYDNHIIEIGESMEYVAFRLYLGGLSIDAISEVTYLNTEIIKNSITKYE